ncbi:MAG TPA: SRPBCC family protein [Polyangiaceae bacterium]
MQELWEVSHVSVSIRKSPEEVYEFAAKPENWPSWARGLAGTMEQVDGVWVADSPMGKVRVRFAEKNAFGVLDHDVTLPSGVTVHNAFRVLPNSEGSEVVFSIFRRPEMSREEFLRDQNAVNADLKALKALIERSK